MYICNKLIISKKKIPVNNSNNYSLVKKLSHKQKMPQLVPFYFMNQVIFAFVSLVIILYVLSKYILPRFVRLFITRMFISKL